MSKGIDAIEVSDELKVGELTTMSTENVPKWNSVLNTVRCGVLNLHLKAYHRISEVVPE